MTDPNTTDGSQEDLHQEPKTFDAEYVAKLRSEAAEYRTKAKANADAADELARIKESQKTEAEKAAERLAELEAENLTTKAELIRLRVASKHGISAEDAELFLTGTDEDSLIKQAERLAAMEPAKKPRGSYVPNEGKNPNSPGDGNELRDVARNLFNRS